MNRETKHENKTKTLSKLWTGDDHFRVTSGLSNEDTQPSCSWILGCHVLLWKGQAHCVCVLQICTKTYPDQKKVKTDFYLIFHIRTLFTAVCSKHRPLVTSTAQNMLIIIESEEKMRRKHKWVQMQTLAVLVLGYLCCKDIQRVFHLINHQIWRENKINTKMRSGYITLLTSITCPDKLGCSLREEAHFSHQCTQLESQSLEHEGRPPVYCKSSKSTSYQPRLAEILYLKACGEPLLFTNGDSLLRPAV